MHIIYNTDLASNVVVVGEIGCDAVSAGEVEVDGPLGLAALLPRLVGAQRAPPFSPSQDHLNSIPAIFLKSEGVYNVHIIFAEIVS